VDKNDAYYYILLYCFSKLGFRCKMGFYVKSIIIVWSKRILLET